MTHFFDTQFLSSLSDVFYFVKVSGGAVDQGGPTGDLAEWGLDNCHPFNRFLRRLEGVVHK